MSDWERYGPGAGWYVPEDPAFPPGVQHYTPDKEHVMPGLSHYLIMCIINDERAMIWACGPSDRCGVAGETEITGRCRECQRQLSRMAEAMR
ncbi:MAG: hypothetical protein MPK62_00960 [Alphaproteobacteria bacterium]|nr:hypothetical protein [Alphaproteobacteria bacterium]MDA8029704.1 hypothetical protein [Alphaproteobacteria bacterium]